MGKKNNNRCYLSRAKRPSIFPFIFLWLIFIRRLYFILFQRRSIFGESKNKRGGSYFQRPNIFPVFLFLFLFFLFWAASRIASLFIFSTLKNKRRKTAFIFLFPHPSLFQFFFFFLEFIFYRLVTPQNKMESSLVHL